MQESRVNLLYDYQTRMKNKFLSYSFWAENKWAHIRFNLSFNSRAHTMSWERTPKNLKSDGGEKGVITEWTQQI